MTYEPLTFLPQILAGGAALVLTILTIRLADQWGRDTGRVVVSIRWPRNVTDKQVLAVVRAILGLAPATTGLSGRASVALEVVGTANGITFRLRLPAEASTYFIAQLRTAVPGLAVETIENFKPDDARRPWSCGGASARRTWPWRTRRRRAKRYWRLSRDCGAGRLSSGSSWSAAASRLGPRNGGSPKSWAGGSQTVSGGG